MLKDREWICPQCGACLDRDVNAAINIKNLGLAMLSA
ncbi:zinc ribbon domain-containing protein [Anaerotignum faecicola]